MSNRITIEQVDEPGDAGLSVADGETILDAALAAGIPYPHGCQSGNCGACKSSLLAGAVDLLPYSDYALAATERAAGLILACRAMPLSDCRVAWLEADETAVFPMRSLDCRVVALDDATHDIKRLRLAVDAGGPYDFAAGQYAQLSFPGLPQRDYSMANRPDEAVLEFHIRLFPDGAVTPFVARTLAPGDAVHVEGPFGTAYLRKRHRGPIVALAGGTGLAPVKAIVETALAKSMTQDIHLYLGVRAERDIYLEEHFRALAAHHENFRFTVVLSEPDGPTRRRTGFLHQALAADHDDLDGVKLYLAGPPPMVEAALEVARTRGARRQDCHADAFYSAAEKQVLEATS